MAKAKSKATIMVADGTEGMVKMQDRRFERGAWPIRFAVPKEQADTWLKYFFAECQRHGWSSSGMGQMEAIENSGSITVKVGGTDKPQFCVVWERKRGGPINVRSRSTGVQELPLVEARELFDQVNERCRSGDKDRVYRRGQLEYDGLPWCGEFWLDDTLRLGPPSRQYERALLGPRVIIVDAVVSCVGPADAGSVFNAWLGELSAFLSVVMGIGVQMPEQGQVWTWSEGTADCAVRQLGYMERENRLEMPARGEYRSVPLTEVNRPDFSLRGIDGSKNEQSLPADITDLWTWYRTLSADQRRQFLQAAAKWQEALKVSPDSGTLSFALMVVACEALKPAGTEFRKHNLYHVTEALLGKAVADRLLEPWFQPQNVRNVHLHRGEFRGDEFMETVLMQSYQDPTFDQARRALAPIVQESIIEWLRRQGKFTMPPIKGRLRPS
jgi:hypothetical protein